MSSGTLLYVEDEEDDVFFMQRACGRVGFKAELKIVPDGRSALDYLAGSGRFADRTQYPFPDVMVLDLKLPMISGLDLLKAVKSNPEYAALVVVLLTSSNQLSDLTRAYQLGVNSYLIKPSVPSEFDVLIASFHDYWFVRNRLPARAR